jgi:D-3-phosphoglycerate dehydrogenase / 2-oxoglutarate reductase
LFNEKSIVMYQILTLDKIELMGLSHFPAGMYETGTDFSDPDAIILRSNNLHAKEFSPNTQAIARAGAGVNNIPVERCTKQGIVVFNTPGANANGVKELVLAGMLLASRNIIGGVEWAKTLIGNGDQVPAMIEKGKGNFAGNEIIGKTLVVAGLGAVGLLVANAGTLLGMKVLGYDPFISIQKAQKLSDKIKMARNLDAVIANADFVSLNIPLTDQTRGFINRDKISLMKTGVKIMNFARGELVNNTDMAEALESGKVSKYVTDFPNEDTLKMKNTVCIPHLGASTEESEVNCVAMAADQLVEFFERGNIINSVNFPNMEMDVSGGMRIVVANKNIPNMVSQISAILAHESLNILDMINKNKGEIAYNIIDVDKHKIHSDIIRKIREIDGVFMARAMKNTF